MHPFPLDPVAVALVARGADFVAVQAGMDRNYRPMAAIFAELIERSAAAP